MPQSNYWDQYEVKDAQPQESPWGQFETTPAGTPIPTVAQRPGMPSAVPQALQPTRRVIQQPPPTPWAPASQGESFQHAMQRAVQMGKTVTPGELEAAEAGLPTKALGVAAAAPAIGFGGAAALASPTLGRAALRAAQPYWQSFQTQHPLMAGLTQGIAADEALKYARKLPVVGPHIPPWADWAPLLLGGAGGLGGLLRRGATRAAESEAGQVAERAAGNIAREDLHKALEKVLSGKATASELKEANQILRNEKKAQVLEQQLAKLRGTVTKGAVQEAPAATRATEATGQLTKGKLPERFNPIKVEAPPAPTRVGPAKLTQAIQSEPGYAYHATNADRLQEIADTGKLQTHAPSHGTDQNVWPDGSRAKRAYFSNKANTVWQFAPEEGKPVVIRYKGTGLLRESTGDLYSTKPIDAQHLEYLGEDHNWHEVSQLSSKIKGSFQQGGVVPQTGTYKLHRGEAVIPAPNMPNFSWLNFLGSQGDVLGGLGGGPRATTPMSQRRPYFGPKKAPGMVQPGNIDLTRRPRVLNPDGTYSTLRSMSIDEDGKSILIPTVVNGRVVSDQEAIQHYLGTGEHLGKFDNFQNADAHSIRLHAGQDRYYSHNQAMTPLGSFQQGGIVPQTGPYLVHQGEQVVPNQPGMPAPPNLLQQEIQRRAAGTLAGFPGASPNVPSGLTPKPAETGNTFMERVVRRYVGGMTPGKKLGEYRDAISEGIRNIHQIKGPTSQTPIDPLHVAIAGPAALYQAEKATGQAIRQSGTEISKTTGKLLQDWNDDPANFFGDALLLSTGPEFAENLGLKAEAEAGAEAGAGLEAETTAARLERMAERGRTTTRKVVERGKASSGQQRENATLVDALRRAGPWLESALAAHFGRGFGGAALPGSMYQNVGAGPGAASPGR